MLAMLMWSWANQFPLTYARITTKKVFFHYLAWLYPHTFFDDFESTGLPLQHLVISRNLRLASLPMVHLRMKVMQATLRLEQNCPFYSPQRHRKVDYRLLVFASTTLCSICNPPTSCIPSLEAASGSTSPL